jgi:hypothetical protein
MAVQAFDSFLEVQNFDSFLGVQNIYFCVPYIFLNKLTWWVARLLHRQSAYLVGRESEISGESRGSSGDWV